MRYAGKWVLFVAVVAVCVGTGYAAYSLAGTSWDQVVSYRAPYASMDLPQAPAESRVASRTVMVIIDGLRLDASRKMGTLNSLREYGADLELTAPQPSLSYPNWTTLLSGAPPYVSGVVTNWHEGGAGVETIFDTAKRARVRTVFVGPEDFDALYDVKKKASATFMLKWSGDYLSGRYVDEALRLAKSQRPRLLVVHLPDVDEAGHAGGGSSAEYAETVSRVDADLARLVGGLQDGHTVFIVAADHGHIDRGGHGGWENEVVTVPVVFAGPDVALADGDGPLEAVAPTVAMFAGAPIPRYASAGPLVSVLGSKTAMRPGPKAQQERVIASYATIADADGVSTRDLGSPSPRTLEAAQRWRLSQDRTERLPMGVAGAVAALLAVTMVAVASRPALYASLIGALTYFGFYNLLFFVVHRYDWSLSAFNSEDLIESWMNTRLLEAGAAALVAVAVASAVYPYVRRNPKGPRGEYLPGWLTLGPATILVTLALLGIQVAWFIWWWGIFPVWRLPDLHWGFKYDLDLIQATAIGFTAAVSPVVSYLVGRYHPAIRALEPPREDPGSAGAPVPNRPLVPAGTGAAAEE